MYYANFNRTSKERFRETTRLTSYDYTDNNLNYFKQNGYEVIGYDAIRHTYIGYQEAVNAGCWIGASVMLYKHQYVGTASGQAVVPFYNPGESYTVTSRTSGNVAVHGSASASVVGNGGYAYGSSSVNGYGTYNSSTTTTYTTPGSFSYYAVPYSHDYYDQYAIFLAKKYYRFGLDISLLEKKDLKSRVIMTLPGNSWFEVIDKGKMFTKVVYQGRTGYILSSYELK